MTFSNLDPPRDLYFLLLFGLLFFGLLFPSLLSDLGVITPTLSAPIVPTAALTAIGALFLGGAVYLYWTRSRGGENPFRPERDD